MFGRLGRAALVGALMIQNVAVARAAPLPPWLATAIEAEKKSAHPGKFEEATYHGNRVFEFERSGIADADDQFTLFADDGQVICKFGGIVGTVTSGACDMESIRYVRMIYPN